MSEGYRMMNVVKAQLQKQNHVVYRPMSIRLVVVIWFVLLCGSLYGAYEAGVHEMF